MRYDSQYLTFLPHRPVFDIFIDMMKKIGLIFIVLCAFPTLINGQQLDIQNLNSYFDILSENDKFMGTVLIQKEGRTLFSKAVGKRSQEKALENMPQTVYRLGSISKTFTATMIFQLIEEEQLSLKTNLATYFPDLTHSEIISIGQLLRHESGIFDFTSDPAYGTYMFTRKQDDEIYALIKQGAPAFIPGKATAYSNTNFWLLSRIIELLDGQDYAISLQERIIRTLGTSAVSYGHPADILKNEAHSYLYNGQEWLYAGETHMSIPKGAGALMASVEDVAKFYRMLLHTEDLLRRKTRKQMLKVGDDRYAYGIFELPYDDIQAYGHGGAIDGFRTRVAYLPNEDITVVILCNGLNYNMREIADTLLHAVQGKPIHLPMFATIELDETQLARYPGMYTTDTIPLAITVTIIGGKVVIQATGQQAFTLDTETETKFSFVGLGLKIEFDTLIDSKYQYFDLRQAGETYRFSRK